MDDLQKIIKEVTDVAKGVLGKDLSEMEGFSRRQLEAIGQQAVTIKNGILSGATTPDLVAFFFEGLKTMTRNFIDTLVGLALVTAEKLWNALVEKFWEMINAVN